MSKWKKVAKIKYQLVSIILWNKLTWQLYSLLVSVCQIVFWWMLKTSQYFLHKQWDRITKQLTLMELKLPSTLSTSRIVRKVFFKLQACLEFFFSLMLGAVYRTKNYATEKLEGNKANKCNGRLLLCLISCKKERALFRTDPGDR